MITLKQINAELSRRGVKERLYRGEGYFYFIEGDAHLWYSSVVSAYRLKQLTMEQWLSEWKRLSGNDNFPVDTVGQNVL